MRCLQTRRARQSYFPVVSGDDEVVAFLFLRVSAAVVDDLQSVSLAEAVNYFVAAVSHDEKIFFAVRDNRIIARARINRNGVSDVHDEIISCAGVYAVVVAEGRDNILARARLNHGKASAAVNFVVALAGGYPADGIAADNFDVPLCVRSINLRDV